MAARSLRASLVLCAVVACAGLGACTCNKKPLQSGGRGDAGPGPGGLTADQASRVVARIGERTLTLGDFAATLERMDAFDRLRYQTPERRRELLEEIVNAELLALDAREKGLDKQPETEDAIRQILRDALLAEARKDLPPPAEIPADEVRAYYEAHRDEFRDPERRRVAHILVRDKKTALDVIESARKATPMQWGELARKHSLEPVPKPSPTQPLELAGDLGLCAAPGEPRGDNPRVPAEVRAAVFDLRAVGDVLDRPVESKAGWHVVRMTGKTDAHERSLADADRAIRVSLLQARIAAREKALEDDLRRQFPVTVDEAALGKVEVPRIEGAPDAGAANGDGGAR